MWNDFALAVSSRTRRRRRRTEARESEGGEILVVIREDSGRGPCPVVTGVSGLPEVQRIVSHPRRRHGSTREVAGGGRSVYLQISESFMLQLTAVKMPDSSTELLAMLQSSFSEPRMEYEVASRNSSDEIEPERTPESVLETLPRVRVDTSKPKACVICYEEFCAKFEALRLPCGHLYHKACIYPWLRRQNSCPSCRMSVFDGDRVVQADSSIEDAADDVIVPRRRGRIRRRNSPPSPPTGNESFEEPRGPVYIMDVEQMEDGFYRLKFRLDAADDRERRTSPVRRIVGNLQSVFSS